MNDIGRVLALMAIIDHYQTKHDRPGTQGNERKVCNTHITCAMRLLHMMAGMTLK